MTSPDTDLTISRALAASPDRVWAAWTTPEHLAKWWIPEPMDCKVVTLDVRPGGGLVTQMREPGGSFVPHLTACFLDVVPQRRLVWTTALAQGWRPIDPWLAITATITLDAEPGGTRYTAHVMHKTAADCLKHQDLGFQDGWGLVIDQLGKLLETLK